MKLADELEKAVNTYQYIMIGHWLEQNRHEILAALRDAEFYREGDMQAHKDCDRLQQSIDELERKCEGLQFMVGELKADRIDLLAQNRTLQQAIAEARAEQAWIRSKVQVSKDSPSHEVYGKLHVWEHDHLLTKELIPEFDARGRTIRALEAALQAERDRLAEAIEDALNGDDK